MTMKLHPIEFRLFNFLNTLAVAHQSAGKPATFILLVSGGKDSVALLSAFCSIRDRSPKPLMWSNIVLRVVHFNHQQRGIESDGDEQFVIDLCLSNALDCSVFRWENWNHQDKATENFQAMARLWRRTETQALLDNTLKDGCKGYIVSAHHLDDLCEGMLLNLIRGTGIDGLSGLTPVDGHLLKPFAHETVEDLVKYLSERQALYRTDSSNLTLDYRRNIVRLQILPLLAALNPAIREALFGLSQSCREARDVMKMQLSGDNATHTVDSGNIVLPLEASATPTSVLRGLREINADFAKNLTLKSARNILHHYHLILMQSWAHPEIDWESEATLKKIPIRSGWMAVISLRKLVFYRTPSDN